MATRADLEALAVAWRDEQRAKEAVTWWTTNVQEHADNLLKAEADARRAGVELAKLSARVRELEQRCGVIPTS